LQLQPTTTGKEMVLVTVEDTGIGISEENQKMLFRPFKQAQRSAGGTGLGLFSLAKRIEALEGTCGVRNRTDGKQGSVFWFTFPYRPDFIAAKEYEQMISKTSSRSGSGSQHSGGSGSPRRSGAAGGAGQKDAEPGNEAVPPLSILLTDDSPSILKVTTRFLEKSGHNVETAENGNQCLERLKEGRHEFDLLITDLQMPVMDGFESVRRFRNFERSNAERLGEGLPPPPLVIVGMSAKADDITKKEALAAGMDLFITKPFRYDQLVEALQQTRKSETLKESVKIFGRNRSGRNASTRSSAASFADDLGDIDGGGGGGGAGAIINRVESVNVSVKEHGGSLKIGDGGGVRGREAATSGLFQAGSGAGVGSGGGAGGGQDGGPADKELLSSTVPADVRPKPANSRLPPLK
jgi:CheY-like chemotaxis protein